MYSFPSVELLSQCSISSSNCCFLTCMPISQEASQVVWYSHPFKNFPQFVVIHTVKGFGIVSKAEVDIFLELTCFLVIQWMSAIWSLVPLPFLNPALTSASSWFMHCWSLAWRILSITLLACEVSAMCVSVSILWHYLSLGWNENGSFPALWPLLSFPNLLAYWVQHFHSIIIF